VILWSGMRAKVWASQVWGSTLFSLTVSIRVYAMAAARLSVGESTNKYFVHPNATERIARSAVLLSNSRIL